MDIGPLPHRGEWVGVGVGLGRFLGYWLHPSPKALPAELVGKRLSLSHRQGGLLHKKDLLSHKGTYCPTRVPSP